MKNTLFSKKGILYALLFPLIFYSSCTGGIGDTVFKLHQPDSISIDVPTVGIFNFKQNIEKGIDPIAFETLLKVDSEKEEIINYKLINFKSEVKSYENIEFVFRDSIISNVKEFDTLNVSGTTKINDKNIFISVFEQPSDTTNLAGNYLGVAELIETDTNSQKASIKELYNIDVSINTLGQLLILPIEENDFFASLSGVYSINSQAFSGKISSKDTVKGSVKRLTDTIAIDFKYPVLKDTLSITIDNQTQKLFLNINQLN